MPRSRSPDRDKAFELWCDSGGEMKLKDIAAELGVSDSQVRKWKNQDRWDERLKGNVTEPNSNVTKRKRGAPKGSKNALGNSGGSAPQGNANAVTHGFFRKIFPAEALPVVDDIMSMDPLDILWQNIVIQYTAIARAQQIMFVKNAEDHSVFRTQVRGTFPTDEHGEPIEGRGFIEETEEQIQYAWDKHANFLKAQSRAISTLEGLISRYQELLPTSPKAQEHRLKLEKLRAEIDKLTSGSGAPDDGMTIVVDYGDADA